MSPTDKIYTWYMTISPAPRKMHGSRAYQACQDVRQKEIIMKAIDGAKLWHNAEYKPLVHFEYNKRLQVHCHFQMAGTQRELRQFQVNINDRLGSMKLSPDICCNACYELQWIPKDNPDTGKPYATWEEYCNKENILPPQLVRCHCTPCKLEYDKRTISKETRGEIIIG